jgi:hypothetical protein
MTVKCLGGSYLRSVHVERLKQPKVGLSSALELQRADGIVDVLETSRKGTMNSTRTSVTIR